jgi:hypothetical protein
VKSLEANTQAAILELLAAHHIFAFRINTGGFGGSHKGKKWFVKAHSLGKGCADILALPMFTSLMNCGGCGFEYTSKGHALPTWIEVKSPGKKQSPEQVSFQELVESLGHKYLLIDNINVLSKWLAEF